MFTRIRILLAAFDRLEFCEAGLAARLEQFNQRNERTLRPSRNVTIAGMAIGWSEP